MDEKLKLIAQSLGPERIKFSEKLASHTFSKSSGQAQGFYTATTQQELIQILDLVFDLKIPFFIIGSGTKVLVSSEIKGLTIKNRSSAVKVAGVKGKISRSGMGVEEMFIETDSGVSLGKLNEFISSQSLQEIDGFSSLKSTVGGSIFLDPLLRRAVQSIRVWHEGEVSKTQLVGLLRSMVVLSVIFKFKAKPL